MNVKIQKKTTGIPKAQVKTAGGTCAKGTAEVTIFVNALDEYDIPTVVASMRMSVSEARALANQIEAAAHAAEDTQRMP